MPRHARTVERSLKCELSLPFRCTTQHEAVVLPQSKTFSKRLKFLGCDAVSGKLVGVENPFHTGQFGCACKFSAEPRKLRSVLVQRLCADSAEQALERERQNNRSVGKTARDHARFGVRKDARDVVKVKREVVRNGLGNPLFHGVVIVVSMRWQGWEVKGRSQLVCKTIKMELSSHFQTDDLWNPRKVLTPFDLHPIPRSDRDVEILTNAP